MSVVVTGTHWNHAAIGGHAAGGVFELYRGVGNVEALRQHAIQPSQNGITGGRRNVFNQDVATQRVISRMEPTTSFSFKPRGRPSSRIFRDS